MAARRVTLQLVRVGTGALLATIPLVSYKVHAYDGSEEDDGKPRIRITELPIYGNPEDRTRYRYVDEEINPIRQAVSTVRLSIWSYLDTMRDTTDSIKETFEIGKAHTQGFIDYVQNDPGMLPRVAVISIAGLGGIVAGYRGGTARKVFYSASAIAAATSFCYPNEAVALSTSIYDRARGAINKILKGPNEEYPTKSPEGQDSLTKEERPFTVSTAKEKEAERAALIAAGVSLPMDKKKMLKGDPGMSKEEDKDLYTTRSK